MLASIISLIANSLTITVLVGYIFALWAALVIWALFDINARTDNPLYKLGAVLLVATGAFFGFAIYLLLRPIYTKDEARMREVEESILASQAGFLTCPSCRQAVREEFAYCPSCSLKLYEKCNDCGKQIIVSWSTCPFCGTEKKISPEPTPVEVPVIPEVPVKVAVAGKGRIPSLTFFSTLAGLLKRRDVKKRAKPTKGRGSTFGPPASSSRSEVGRGKAKKSPRATKHKKS
jgi:hypothetical protein